MPNFQRAKGNEEEEAKLRISHAYQVEVEQEKRVTTIHRSLRSYEVLERAGLFLVRDCNAFRNVFLTFFPDKEYLSNIIRLSCKMASADAYLPLLQMSIALQKEQSKADPLPMDVDRREWLKEAMANSLKSPVDDMKELLKKLKDSLSDDERVAALEALSEFVENIDHARDFYKIGGLAEAIKLLEDPSDKIRASSASTIAVTVQNNPDPQKWALELGALESLTRLVTRERPSARELVKGIHAISSLIRQNDVGTLRFIKDLKGMGILVDVLRKNFDCSYMPANRKAMNLLLYILNRAPATVTSTGPYCVPVVSEVLTAHVEDPDLRESAVGVLRLYATNKQVQLIPSVCGAMRGALGQALEAARIDEHDSVVEACIQALESSS